MNRFENDDGNLLSTVKVEAGAAICVVEWNKYFFLLYHSAKCRNIREILLIL